MNIRVHGKYLTLFNDFVQSWDPQGWYASATRNLHKSKVVEAIAGMHSTFLTASDVEQMLLGLVVAEFVDQMGRPESERLSDEQIRECLLKRLVEYVESLPRLYLLTVQLPNFPDWWSSEAVVLAEDVLVQNDARPSSFEATGMSKVAQALTAIGERPQVALQIAVRGFGEFGADAPAISQAISLAKQIAYLLNAYGVTNSWGTPREADASWRWKQNANEGPAGMVPRSISQLFGQLKINEDSLTVWQDGPTLLGGTQRKAATADEKVRAIAEKLNGIRSALAVREKHDYRSIAAAMEWYQDSIASDNQTVSFISACIGVEALIGSDAQMDMMSDRLADRYAFMTGGSRAERTALRDEFRDLLRLRGQLVHGRQRRLEQNERTKLTRLQSILDQLIRKELGSLLREK